MNVSVYSLIDCVMKQQAICSKQRCPHADRILVRGREGSFKYTKSDDCTLGKWKILNNSFTYSCAHLSFLETRAGEGNNGWWL